MVQKANEMNIPVVSELFIYDSLIKSTLLNAVDYPVIANTFTFHDLGHIYPIDFKEILSFFELEFNEFNTKLKEFSTEFDIVSRRRYDLNNPYGRQAPRGIIEFYNHERTSDDSNRIFSNILLLLKDSQNSFTKIKALELVIFLYELNYQVIDQFIIKEGIVDVFIILFFIKKRNSSIFLNCISRFLIHSIQSPYHLFVKRYLFNQKNFLSLMNNCLKHTELKTHILHVAKAIKFSLYDNQFQLQIQADPNWNNINTILEEQLLKENIEFPSWAHPKITGEYDKMIRQNFSSNFDT